MNNLRLRFTTLHLAQRLRIDGDTFILYLLLICFLADDAAKVKLYRFILLSSRYFISIPSK